MSELTEAQKNKRYRQFKKYKVICKLPAAEQYCKKYDGSPCCFFCKDKQTCKGACQNEPIGCNYSACKDKNGGIKVETAKLRQHCKGCGHRRPLTNNNVCCRKICHYLLDTGKVRGCPPDECPHYTTEKCHELGKWQTLAEIEKENENGY